MNLSTWFVFIVIALSIIEYETLATPHGVSYTHSFSRQKQYFSGALLARGGFSENDSDDEAEGYDEYEEEEEDNDDNTELEPYSSTEGSSPLVTASKRVLVLFGKATVATVSAVARAVRAAFEGNDVEQDEEAEELSTVSKIINVIKRMWNAALNPSGSAASDEQSSSSPAKKEKEEPSSINDDEKQSMGRTSADFGSFLSKTYGVSDGRNKAETPAPVLGGTIGDALRSARSQARLLVVYIPASAAGKKKSASADQAAISSLLSPEVSEAASKRAKKKVDSGSFVLWGAKAGSPEAVTAIKRLRAKQPGGKGGKRPMLLVAYPAQVVDSYGKPKLVPRLLAQHHCNPPPSAESMAAWLNALRKRHSKQYSSMQHHVKETQLFKERQEGYKSSVESDVQRQEQEKKAEQERLAKEAAEKQRLEELEQRRAELKASLPEEPAKDVPNTMTIALRFPDGRAGQRRFSPETPLSALFNWVDAVYEMERETVILTTMNGKKSFSWDDAAEDDVDLSETGLGRMTGLRVTQKKVQTEDAQEEKTSQPAAR